VSAKPHDITRRDALGLGTGIVALFLTSTHPNPTQPNPARQPRPSMRKEI
jgi:hypothetical protein